MPRFGRSGSLMFQNPEIAIEELPSTDDLDWEPLHRSYARKIRVALYANRYRYCLPGLRAQRSAAAIHHPLFAMDNCVDYLAGMARHRGTATGIRST